MLGARNGRLSFGLSRELPDEAVLVPDGLDFEYLSGRPGLLALLV